MNRSNTPGIILEKFKQIRGKMDKIGELTKGLPRGVKRQFLYEDYTRINERVEGCEAIIKGIYKNE